MTCQELRALAEAVDTPGPWFLVRIPGHDFAADVGTTPDPDVGQAVAAATIESPACLINDAAFIAAANPTAVLALLDERDALRAQVERVRALDSVLSKVLEMYRHLAMDTPEDQALHARVIEQSDNALRLLRAALDGPA